MPSAKFTPRVVRANRRHADDRQRDDDDLADDVPGQQLELEEEKRSLNILYLYLHSARSLYF